LSSNKPARVAAVVVTYNRRAELDCCLRSLLAQTHRLHTIYVIDNASKDGTDDLLRDHYASSIQHCRLTQNSGCAGALQYGIALAHHDGHDWIWLLDDDGCPAINCLDALLKAGTSVPGVAAVSPQKRSVQGERLPSEMIWDSASSTFIPVFEMARSGSWMSIDYAGSCGLLLNTSVISPAGLPRGDFFMELEDYEYCTRLTKHGRIIWAPSALLTHPPQQPALSSAVFWRRYYWWRNLIYCSHHLRLKLFPGMFRTVRSVAGESGAILLRYDRRLWRLGVILFALWHGWRGKLGRAPKWVHTSGERTGRTNAVTATDSRQATA